MSERVSVNFSGHIAHVTLTRSEKMNALDPAMFEAIVDTIDDLKSQSDLRAVVVSGEGKALNDALSARQFWPTSASKNQFTCLRAILYPTIAP